jgi:hypothetical protein
MEEMFKGPEQLSRYKGKLSRYLHAGEKGERRYSSYSFLTSTLDGVEWSASRFTPGKDLKVPIG